MKRGNGANCTSAGADVSKFLAQAKARAALAKSVTSTDPTKAAAPASVSAKSTLGMAIMVYRLRVQGFGFREKQQIIEATICKPHLVLMFHTASPGPRSKALT